jgi:exodeoxyribonuclease VII small subunit
MAQDREAAEAFGDAILEALDVVVLELEDETAFDADEMVVVIADDLEARLAIAELALDREAAVDEQLERSVDGRVTDARVTLADFGEELVDRDVIARAEKLLDDRFALRRRVESTVLDVRPPPLLELARIVGPKVRTLPHECFSFPATLRFVKRSRRDDFSVSVRYGADAVAAPSAEPGFDAILVRLREVVQKLESGELSLEQSLAVYEEGVQLARKGQQLLASAEKRVEILVSASGGVETAPFTSTSDDANGT